MCLVNVGSENGWLLGTVFPTVESNSTGVIGYVAESENSEDRKHGFITPENTGFSDATDVPKDVVFYLVITIFPDYNNGERFKLNLNII